MKHDPVVAALHTRVNKRSTVYVFETSRNRSRTMFVMGDARRFTLRQARAEARRLLVIVEKGGDPRPYRRRAWCDNCGKPWDADSQKPTCLECRTSPCAECGEMYEEKGSAAVANKRRYCSRACKNKASRSLGEHECGQCGAVFGGRADSANKYCSRACAFERQRDEASRRKRELAGQKDQARKARELASHDIACVGCGGLFDGASFQAIYCGEGCRAREYRRRRWRNLAGGATRILAATSGNTSAGERALDAYLE